MPAIDFLSIASEVSQALAANGPVVALESTVIAHGLPHPDNVLTAIAMEDTVRASGAVPATIAVMDGKIIVGLTHDQIERLGTATGVVKASRRDLGVALASRGLAATTVAGTLACCELAGIRVFATGGIGGVHRGGEGSLDVSADLIELGRAPVVTVCAGAKAILDLPRTLEYLETHGVPLIGYGTDELPAFYSRESGLPVPHRSDSPDEVALIAYAQHQSGLGGGTLVVVPIPTEHAMPRDLVEQHIQQALADADREHVHGAEVTPFLLGRMATLTSGESVTANRALLLRNAEVAGHIAVALSELS